MYRYVRRVSLTQWILVSMVVGVLLGVYAPDFAQSLKPLSNVFLRMIKSIIVPIIFSTLVVGIAAGGGQGAPPGPPRARSAFSASRASSQSRSPAKTRGRCPPIQYAAALPVARKRCDHFTTLATLTPNSAAVARHVRPPATDATTRSRRSLE